MTSSAISPAIKPCPFCGGTKIEVEELGFNALGRAKCRKCTASGPIVTKTAKKAIAAWNKRAGDTT